MQKRWTEYTGVLEQGCDAALFVGQHAMAGAERGVLSHTVSSTNWHALRFNGARSARSGINAALCGTWGSPVALVTGDDVVCARPASCSARADDARGQDGARPLQRPPPRARDGARAPRGPATATR